MPVEIEAKMQVADHGSVREALRRRHAEGGSVTLETNVFFDTPDRRLLAGDEGLRLRTNHDSATGHETHVVTYKGPRMPGPLKSREEVELTVDDPAATARLFEKLGYLKILSFEKRRQSWTLGGCKVELDELPLLGSFVEVEGPGEREVMAVREALGLADLPMIQTSYIGMLVEHLKAEGQERGEITFGDAGASA